MKHRSFDVVVVGAGHAGVEAAAAAGRMGATVALVTHSAARIGELSCNPAMGGLGKGHLMREVDALGGLVGRASDEAGIQFRVLNRSRGPAVRGPRAQMDRELYRAAMRALIGDAPGVSVVEDEVEAFLENAGVVVGVGLAQAGDLRSASVVLTAGTFLRGVMHRGAEQMEGGRHGDPPSNVLADQVRSWRLGFRRLKTGTPARLVGASIDRTVLDQQHGDETPEPFSFTTDRIQQSQVPCLVTETNARTHAIIRENLERSAMRLGTVVGQGPRYCPSIEDKVERFADKDSHTVFLEPETRCETLFYPNGVSTSLPAEIQESFLRTMRGLERVEIARHGYAIEYDVIDPREIGVSLEIKKRPGLFLAGQVIGTTGYEEAAALGVAAGANAALRAAGMDPVIFGREEAYLGVMIDDLTRYGVTEPYRMFTSRAEHRLHLRADNADRRLSPRGAALGLTTPVQNAAFEERRRVLDEACAALKAVRVDEKLATRLNLPGVKSGKQRTLFDVLGYPEIESGAFAREVPAFDKLSVRSRETLRADALYSAFDRRRGQEARLLEAARSQLIPADFDYSAIPSLSNELEEKLSATRPVTLDQASRIEGMTPAGLTLIAGALRSRNKRSA